MSGQESGSGGGNGGVTLGRQTALVTGLRKFVKEPAPAAKRSAPPKERAICELCEGVMDPDHRHLLNLVERRIVCVCEACYALRSGDAEYRPTATRVAFLENFELSHEQWAAFQIPIGLAFFMKSTTTGGVVAMYPSPAGATESELTLDAWKDVVRANPALVALEADAEALIVNRLSEPPQYVIAPIDRCYALVGLVKASWEGISGGSLLERAVSNYFETLREEAKAR